MFTVCLSLLVSFPIHNSLESSHDILFLPTAITLVFAVKLVGSC